jgi:hypothetical protein
MADYSNSTNYTDIIKNNTQNSTSDDIKKYIRKGKPFITFKGFIILLIDIFMVTGPSLGYFLQSLKFKKTKSSKGFSKSICLIIYTSQILRVFFWIGKPFKITLLYQSILIICFQIYLIYLWVKYHDSESTKNKEKINEQNNYDKKEIIEYIIDWSDTISPNKIWNWSNVIEYYKFMLLIVLFLLLICGVIGIHNPILVNVIGTISVISEASTLIPQIIVSCRTQNASNLSMSMVALWFFGDTCKFIYNIIYDTPIQMIASGGFQIFLDFFSLMQIICYSDNKHYSSTEESNTTVPFSTNSKKVQQINQFMNKLEERYSEEIENKNNSKREDNKIIPDKNDSKISINKVEVQEKIENSDKVEVLEKNKNNDNQDNIDDEENNDNKDNINAETLENLSEEKNENEKKDENKEDKEK